MPDDKDAIQRLRDALQRRASLNERRELSSEQRRANDAVIAEVLDRALVALEQGVQLEAVTELAVFTAKMAQDQVALTAKSLELTAASLRALPADSGLAEALGREAEGLRATADTVENAARMVRLGDAARDRGLVE
jgi:hypothetical protein